MTWLFDDFFTGGPRAWISEAPQDFSLGDKTAFNPDQEKYLHDTLKINPASIINIRQVHGDRVIFAGDVSGLTEADATITTRKDIVLAVRTADCLPVFLYDDQTPAIGLVHAGWKGTQKKITPKTVAVMCQRLGSRPENIKAALGPCIRRCCYRVGEEFLTFFPQEVSKNNEGIYFDLKGGWIKRRAYFRESTV